MKPMLETLEDRVQPSFLPFLTQTLATPLNNIVNDMNAAKTTLTATQAKIQPDITAATTVTAVNTLINDFSVATAAFQRILNDQHAVDALSKADVNFMNLATLTSQDPNDFFTFLFFFQRQLTDPMTTADGIASSVSGIANTTYTANAIGVTAPSIASQTTTPTF
jgi:hypothetical protein